MRWIKNWYLILVYNLICNTKITHSYAQIHRGIFPFCAFNYTKVYSVYYHIILHISPHTICIFAGLCRCFGHLATMLRWSLLQEKMKAQFQASGWSGGRGRSSWLTIKKIAGASKEIAVWMTKSCTKRPAFVQEGGQGKARCCMSLLVRCCTFPKTS